MIQTDTFAKLRKRLEDEQASLRDEIASLDIENTAQHDGYGVGNHMAEDATEVFTRERNLALRSNAQDLLAQVDAALQRIENGTYGICAQCNREIAFERIDALPYATLCIDCQSRAERARN